MRIRNSILVAIMAPAFGIGLPAISAHGETMVRYGISMADIPLTTGQPDRGAGAYQLAPVGVNWVAKRTPRSMR